MALLMAETKNEGSLIAFFMVALTVREAWSCFLRWDWKWRQPDCVLNDRTTSEDSVILFFTVELKVEAAWCFTHSLSLIPHWHLSGCGLRGWGHNLWAGRHCACTTNKSNILSTSFPKTPSAPQSASQPAVISIWVAWKVSQKYGCSNQKSG